MEQRLPAVGLGAALEVDAPHANEPVADHRAARAQRVPQQAGLARTGGANNQVVLAPHVHAERGAVLVVADVETGEVDLGGRGRDERRVDGVGERHPPLDHDGEHTGAAAGDRDPMCGERVSEGRGVVGPGGEVLTTDHPYGQGVDRRRHRADPQDAGAQRLAGAAVLPGQFAVAEDGGPAPPAVDRPSPPGRPDAGCDPPVERGRVRPPPDQQAGDRDPGRGGDDGQTPALPCGGQHDRDGPEQRVADQPGQHSELPADGAGRAAGAEADVVHRYLLCGGWRHGSGHGQIACIRGPTVPCIPSSCGRLGGRRRAS